MRKIPFYPLLVGVALVLGLYSHNRLQLLGPESIVIPSLATIGLSLVLLVIGKLLLKDWSRSALVVTFLLLLILGLGFATKDSLVGIMLLVVSLTVISFLVVGVRRLKSGFLSSSTLVGNILLTCIVVVTAFSALIPELGSTRQFPSVVEVVNANAELRDIYYIVMDKYGSNSVLQDYFGYDNSKMTDWLTDVGFTYYPKSHPNYVQTLVSLASTLNMRYLSEIEINKDRGTYPEGLLSDSLVAEILGDLGYSIVWIGSWWTKTASSSSTDLVYSLGKIVYLSDLVLDVSIIGVFDKFLDRKRSNTSRETVPFQVNSLKEVAEFANPTFTFVHFILPHGPYVFLADGGKPPVSWTASVWDSKDNYQEAYVEQLKYSNSLLKEVIEDILGSPGLTPIIILQSDEGPAIWEEEEYVRSNGTYLGMETEDPTSLVYRFSNFSALLLPGLEDNQKRLYGSSVNTFRLVFRDYFGLDYSPLSERYFLTSSYYFPKELRDVTDIIGNR